MIITTKYSVIAGKQTETTSPRKITHFSKEDDVKDNSFFIEGNSFWSKHIGVFNEPNIFSTLESFENNRIKAKYPFIVDWQLPEPFYEKTNF